MEKKIVRGQEQTHKKIEKKTDSGDFLSKVKEGVNKPNPNAASKRILHDRGDSRKARTEGVQIKYDANKINKAVAANFKSIKQTTSVVNRNGAQTKKNNAKHQPNSTDVELEAKILKSHSNRTNIEPDAAIKAKGNVKIADGKDIRILGKRLSEKEPLIQTSASKNDRETRNKTKDDGRNRAKVKEVITIPYMLVDDHQQDADESISLKAESAVKVKSGAKPKAVTFKDRSGRSPKLTKRESKRPDSKTRWSKAQNSGKKHRRKVTSPLPTENSANDSLPTEVVKWSPSSVNNHTKPYYEAWVDRSLTAFSKCSEKERLKLEKEIIETLQHFKRTVSPELTYERVNDEAYTGRIKVRRR